MKPKTTTFLIIGLITIITLMFEACVIEEENFAPTASFTVSPDNGSTETVFVFDASASADPEDSGSQLQLRWDFNGDNTWDTDWITEKFYNIQFIDESTYIAKLEVKDTQGATDQTTQTITVNNGSGGSTISDPRDGRTYTTIVIGSQTWFSENLKYQVRSSWCYNDDPDNCETYGPLYDWETAKNICPTGWHLPSDEEWKQLEMQLGMIQSEADDIDWRGTDEGKKMKTIAGWANEGNGINSSGFSGLPGGFRNAFDTFHGLGAEGVWWSSTEYSTEGAMGRMLGYENDEVYRFETFFKTVGASVRCLKD